MAQILERGDVLNPGVAPGRCVKYSAWHTPPRSYRRLCTHRVEACACARGRGVSTLHDSWMPQSENVRRYLWQRILKEIYRAAFATPRKNTVPFRVLKSRFPR